MSAKFVFMVSESPTGWHNGSVVCNVYTEIRNRYGRNVVALSVGKTYHACFNAQGCGWTVRDWGQDFRHLKDMYGLGIHFGALKDCPAPVQACKRFVHVDNDWSMAGRTVWPPDTKKIAAMWRAVELK